MSYFFYGIAILACGMILGFIIGVNRGHELGYLDAARRSVDSLRATSGLDSSYIFHHASELLLGRDRRK